MYGILRDREVAGCSERHLRRCLSSNVQCLQRVELQRKLEGHNGCVNTVSFDTEAGSLLISGSDDQNIILWDWQTGIQRLTFDSGHHNNVFQARMMLNSGGNRIVTCAADGQVRLAELPEGASSVGVSTSLLGQHGGRAHKLALDPLNPSYCFYSCGEDGQVVHYDLRCAAGLRHAGSSSSSSSRSGRRKLLICRGYSKSKGPSNRVVGLNAIHCNPTRPWQFAVGGCDPWARVFDCRRTKDTSAAAIGPPTRDQARDSRLYFLCDEPVARLCPQHLWQSGRPGSFGGDPNITCVMFSRHGELVASYNDEDVYLFSSEASSGCLNHSNNHGSSSENEAAAADPGSEHQRQHQQQQSRAAAVSSSTSSGGGSVQQLSPSRRSREEGLAAAAGSSDSDQQQQQQLQAAAADDEEARPRWRRRQQLRPEYTAAAAAEAPLGSEVDPLSPAAAAAAPSQPSAAAAAVIDISDLDALDDDIEAQQCPQHPHHHQQQQQQQQQAAARSGRGFGIPAATFYDSNSYNRDGVVAGYFGHRNAATVKGVGFLGEEDEYIISGSDCGHIYVWNKRSGEIVWWAHGDEEVVNCLEPHPFLPLVLATSGIEHDIKIWAPTGSKPQPPLPLTLQRVMANNRRDREASRDAFAQPEQWLLQLLAAQRRRELARQRARREAAAAAGAAGPGPVDGSLPAASAAVAAAAAAENVQGTSIQGEVTGADNNAEGNDDNDDEEDQHAQGFIRFLRPGVVQVNLGDLAARRRQQGGRHAAGDIDENDDEDDVMNDDSGNSEDEEGSEGGSDAGDDDGDDDGDDRPCYVS